MTQTHLIIFDCDGVLIDSEPLASRTLAEALRGAGLALTPAEIHRLVTGKAEVEIRELMVRSYGLCDVDAVFADWHLSLYRAFSAELRPMDGMVELVRLIGTAKCVASNSAQQRLRASLGITPLWAEFAPHIYGADSVARPKPAPDLLLHCASMLGVAPEKSLMIDDSPHGVAAALAAGMGAVGFVDPADIRTGREEILRAAGAHHVVTGTDQLRHLLGEMDCLDARQVAGSARQA